MTEDTSKTPSGNDPQSESEPQTAPVESRQKADRPKEIGGRGGLDPTRYGDWEKDGRCIDF
ncbi:MAG: DUF1674 domain-containing protein [Woeseiaceae bacterium]|nr:DUF1674 domain-containing protein [Woeseiaceae bacterium]